MNIENNLVFFNSNIFFLIKPFYNLVEINQAQNYNKNTRQKNKRLIYIYIDKTYGQLYISNDFYFDQKVYFFNFQFLSQKKERQIHLKIMRRRKRFIQPLFNNKTLCFLCQRVLINDRSSTIISYIYKHILKKSLGSVLIFLIRLIFVSTCDSRLLDSL